MRRRRATDTWLVVTAGVALGVGALLVSASSEAAQTLRNKRIYFGDMHWHSCLSQDAQGTTPTSQYWSMLYDYGLDFAMQSEHAEAADAGIYECDDYLPLRESPSGPPPYTGNAIANAMKAAADDWYGRELESSNHGLIQFVTFPGYEWAPDARCWTLGWDTYNDLNSDDSTPGHISYFFSDTTGWNYRDDVWAPGPGPSVTCMELSIAGFAYYDGLKDYADEILGQLIHQRDDPLRSYDLLIQYNHPAASIDRGGSSDHLAKWFDHDHDTPYCSIASSLECEQIQCASMRRAYGVNSVEWYTSQEATLGSTGAISLGSEEESIGYHHEHHRPADYVSSRGLREGYRLASTGGSDSHGGRKSRPDGFPGDRGAGSGSLTAVYATEATRPGIWEGVSRKRTYALSRFRGIGPVHKGRVDLVTTESIEALPEAAPFAAFALPGGPVGGVPSVEYGMGELVAALPGGSLRTFTVTAAAEEGTTGVYPLEVRLYRVAPNTPLSEKTDWPAAWLDDVPGDPGKLGELVGKFVNEAQAPVIAPTFNDVLVQPDDAIFAVVPYSDSDWVDTFYARDKSELDLDGDGVPDAGKSGYVHAGNNTWARTTPITFYASQERPDFAPACENVTFNFSGAVGPQAEGGVDVALPGDDAVLPVAVPGFYYREWNRWRFTLASNYEYLDLSFLTARDDSEPGTLFAVRIDGRLVYSGRSGIDHEADELVDLRDLHFPIKAGLHQLEVHMDDQEYATGGNNPNFHCPDYDGAAAFIDALMFHKFPGGQCYDTTPPVVSCPPAVLQECSSPGGASAVGLAAWLASASAVDDFDQAPEIVHDGPKVFPLGSTPVTFTASDDSGNWASCSTTVTVRDTAAPAISALELAPSRLRRNSHFLAPIAVSPVHVSDVCDPAPQLVCSVGSDEPVDGRGDGHTRFDMLFDWQPVFSQSTGPRNVATSQGQGDFDLMLRAERSSRGDGRVYTAICQARDATGNLSASTSDTVQVPR